MARIPMRGSVGRAAVAAQTAARVEDVDEEGDEESLTEIEEYLRMAVLLLHADCAFGQRSRQRLH